MHSQRVQYAIPFPDDGSRGAGHFTAMCVGLLLALWVGMSPAYAADTGAAGANVATLDEVADMPSAPEFELTDTQGKVHRLSEYRGRVVVVNFWSVWCAPCRKEMPAMQRAWEQVRDRDVLFLGVNFEDRPDQVAQFFTKISVDFPILLGGDRAMLKSWSVKGLPTTFVIDAQGRLRYQVVGEYHWDQPEALDALMAVRAAAR